MTNDELNPNDEIPSSIRRQIGKRLRVDHSVFVIPSAFVIPVSSFGLKANRMSRVKSIRRPINALPTRRPSAGVMIERCCVESQSGYDSERVAFARVNGDPSTRAAFAIAAELG